MRFKSPSVGGFQVFCVTGVNTVSFGIKTTEAARRNLLGFAVERFEPARDRKFYMYGFKVFPSVIPDPIEGERISTFDHPVQSFVWDDFTAKPDHLYEYTFHPIKGKPLNLDRGSASVTIRVRTEPLFSSETHDIFFNRGVASSQAYEREFRNKKPDELPPAKRKEALQWLSRDLDEAMLRFIGKAKRGDGLLCCFYEFHYMPVVEELKRAADRGVDVKIIIDAKINEYTDDDGFHESFPRIVNRRAIRNAGFSSDSIFLREARPSDIQHNKFMVLVKGARKRPAEVWTGSTNLSTGGIHGQTNVGHWIKDQRVAERFLAYWTLLSDDPGARASDNRSSALRRNKALREAVESLTKAPSTIEEIEDGITPIFSPRTNLDVLDLYVDLLDSAQRCSCITLAFGVGAAFKEQLKDNTNLSHISFLLLEKKDKPNPRSTKPFVKLDYTNNVYAAWGSYLGDAVYQWTRETNARALGFNKHVVYIHSKFLLFDPLGEDPIVVTGSANFSPASQKNNDENMVIIRGGKRVADIYFTEFNRLFNHYYFRSVQEATRGTARSSRVDDLFLKETARDWLWKYGSGKLKRKRLDLYTSMTGFSEA